MIFRIWFNEHLSGTRKGGTSLVICSDIFFLLTGEWGIGSDFPTLPRKQLCKRLIGHTKEGSVGLLQSSFYYRTENSARDALVCCSSKCAQKNSNSLEFDYKYIPVLLKIRAMVSQSYHFWIHWSLPSLPIPKIAITWMPQTWFCWGTAWGPMTELLIPLGFVKAFHQKWDPQKTWHPSPIRYAKVWPLKKKMHKQQRSFDCPNCSTSAWNNSISPLETKQSFLIGKLPKQAFPPLTNFHIFILKSQMMQIKHPNAIYTVTVKQGAALWRNYNISVLTDDSLTYMEKKLHASIVYLRNLECLQP